jgi:hypothetical protein
VTFIRNSFKSSDCTGTPAYSGTTVQPLNKCESDTMYVLTSADDKEPWLAQSSFILTSTHRWPVAPGPNDYPEIFQAFAFSYVLHGLQRPEVPHGHQSAVQNLLSESCSTTLLSSADGWCRVSSAGNDYECICVRKELIRGKTFTSSQARSRTPITNVTRTPPTAVSKNGCCCMHLSR